MPGVFTAFGRLGIRLSRIREVNYSMQDQVLNVGEVRGWDTSHPYLDDAYVEVRITDAEQPRPAERGVLGTRWRAKKAIVAAPDVEFAFGVRHGLKARLPESASQEAKVRRTPKTLELGPESDFRHVVTVDFGPVDHIRDWAVDRMGVATDSSAYIELSRFFSDRNFHHLAKRMRDSPVPGKPLRADDKKGTPLGAFIIEGVDAGAGRAGLGDRQGGAAGLELPDRSGTPGSRPRRSARTSPSSSGPRSTCRRSASRTSFPTG